MNRLINYIVVLVSLLFLLACSGNPVVKEGMRIANEQFEKDRSPFRANAIHTNDGGAILQLVWAGKPGASVLERAEQGLINDVEKLVYEMCNYKKIDLKEIRVVKHKFPVFNEVWVFNDPLSVRTDKTSGFSLVITIPPTGGADIALKGGCGNQKN